MCLALGSSANVIKTLLAKLLASQFHRRAHFDKMQDALQKARNSIPEKNKERPYLLFVLQSLTNEIILYPDDIGEVCGLHSSHTRLKPVGGPTLLPRHFTQNDTILYRSES